MAILEGTTAAGAVVPVQVTDVGRVVAEGLEGPAGPQGPQGEKGDKGDKGDPGAPGEGGGSLRTGELSGNEGLLEGIPADETTFTIGFSNLQFNTNSSAIEMQVANAGGFLNTNQYTWTTFRGNNQPDQNANRSEYTIIPISMGVGAGVQISGHIEFRFSGAFWIVTHYLVGYQAQGYYHGAGIVNSAEGIQRVRIFTNNSFQGGEVTATW